MNEVKDKALQDAFKQIEKQYGKGSIMKMGEKVYDNLDVVS
ncbi:MAG: DNA recombination/repair protein RecA, partial [Bacilli bacterium]|nr:DNA recombination/repair protein RecA [Bacilli bacterium]